MLESAHDLAPMFLALKLMMLAWQRFNASQGITSRPTSPSSEWVSLYSGQELRQHMPSTAVAPGLAV